MRSILAHTPDELRRDFAEAGVEPYRADQVARWVFGRRCRDFADMTDLGRSLRRDLAASWRTRALDLREVRRAADGTSKLALTTDDGAVIETVVIPEQRRHTVCVSSQVGCSLDCSFCATGRMGLTRNLRPDEIVDQLLWAADHIAATRGELSNVVFMGMGEPLLNLTRVVQAIRVACHPRGLGLAPGRITVSTSGVVPRMAELGKSVPVHLAVSLHATTDEVRDLLVPLNRRFPIATLLEACAAYPVSPRDRITFEYALIRDLNDSEADARRLVGLVRGLRSKINLIPLNEHPGTSYRRPEAAVVERFASILEAGGLVATVRRPRGDDIGAACGQLGSASPSIGGGKTSQDNVR